MKISVRNNVFETNSSSSHSFTIIKESEREDSQERLQEIERQLKEIELKEEEARNNNQRLDMELFFEKNRLQSEKNRYLVSFEIKSPLAKLVWLKGLADNAKSSFNENYIEDEEVLDSYEYFSSEVYTLLHDMYEEYARLENITFDEAVERVIKEGNKDLYYENILQDEENLKKNVNKLYREDPWFKEFADEKGYKDKVEALREYAKAENEKRCKDKCVSCEHYFQEGILDECYCGFESFYLISSNFKKYIKGFNYKEFAKEFLTDEYTVIGTENWNNCCILKTNKVY